MNTTPPRSTELFLLKDEDRRLRQGHSWIFSNEIDVRKSSLKGLEPGGNVAIYNNVGSFIGHGYVNPMSLIAVRLVSRHLNQPFSEKLVRERILKAAHWRSQLFAHPCYRMVYADGDFLPGLIIDRFGDQFAVQITTAGMERMEATIVATLVEEFNARSVVLCNDISVRELEGLLLGRRIVYGQPTDLEIHENNAIYHASLMDGQKTGWFYDHRMNRQRLQDFYVGRRVLDLFAYCGSFTVQAALHGASEVVAVDSSRPALDFLRANARLNGVADAVNAVEGDVFSVLESLKSAGETFDLVIIDPPALIARKKDLDKGVEAYRHLNRQAMNLLSPEGLVFSASCSFHLEESRLMNLLAQVSRQAERTIQILARGGQGPDHPVHPSIPETRYLKSFLARCAAK